MNIKKMISKKIVSCDQNCSIYEASCLMKEKRIGFLPITDQNKIIGVITDRDIVVNMLANHEDVNTKIIDYANKNIVSADINSNVEDILKKMVYHQIRRIIITEKNNVKGIISLSDILNSNIDFDNINDFLKGIFSLKTIKDDKTEIDDFYL